MPARVFPFAKERNQLCGQDIRRIAAYRFTGLCFDPRIFAS